MCGIAGEFSFDAPVDPATVRRMADSLIHRGPDDSGLYCDGQIGLGHRRLSIIDLSSNGRQPLWTADRAMAIVFNGEIYNYREIRPDLEAKGYSFQGGSDTEVLLNAIHCWGLDAALKRAIGMFAFAVWDARTRELFLVRDRLGIKPLYYYRAPKRLLFGSELRAIYAHSEFGRDLSTKGLAQFFCYGYTLGDTTVFRETFKLPAGHYVRISDNGDSSLKQYWAVDNVERGSFRGTFQEALEGLKEICDSAFRYRLVSDVPVGVFLSGGVDSSFLSAFLRRRLNVELECLTIRFEDSAFDESPNAAKVAQDLGLRHSIATVSEQEAQRALLRFVDIWDEPFGDTSGIPTSILSVFARQRVKVALSADGGDELFCGYESYPLYANQYKRLASIPLPIRRLFATMLRKLPAKRLISALLAENSDNRRNPQTFGRYEKALDLMTVEGNGQLIRVMNEKGYTAKSVTQLLGAPSPREFVSGTAFDVPESKGKPHLIDQMMRTDLAAFLCDDILTKVDRASMAASLECRDPLLDHRLVEFAFSLPLDYLYSPGRHKRLIKHLLSEWIDPRVVNAPKKGFSIPLYKWLRGPWKPLVDDYLAPDRIRQVGVLNEPAVRQRLRDFYEYRGGRAEPIMLTLLFQMWAERWFRR